MSDNLRGSLWMVLAMAGFGVEDAFFKAATATGTVSAGSGMVLFGSMALALSALLARARGVALWHPGYLRRQLLLRSGFELVGRLFFALSLAYAPLAVTSAILQAAPIVVMLGAVLVLGERIGPRRWLAAAIGLAGVVVILRPSPEGIRADTLLAVAAMLGFALRDLVTRATPADVHGAQLGILGFAVVILAGLAILAAEPGPPPLPDGRGLALIAATALAGLAGYSALTAAMRTGEIAVVAPFRYFRLIVALVLALAVFGERPDAATLAGAAAIVGAGLYALLREGRRRAGLAGADRLKRPMQHRERPR
ncbi:MAG: DMT family transporter [Roseovarius sp.]